MSEISVFESPVTGQRLRVFILDGEPWFAVADVCRELEIANPRAAVATLDADERVDHAVGKDDTMIKLVSEPGLYSLILRSRKPQAVALKRWITHEVLPVIRKTGSYSVEPAVEPREITRRQLAEMVIQEADRADRAEEALAIAAPDAEKWQVLASAEGDDHAVADAAKFLSRDPRIKLGRDRLFTLLAEWGWIYRQKADQRWRPYQIQVEAGNLSEIAQTHYHPRTGVLVEDAPQVRVTTRGVGRIHQRLTGGAKP